MLELYNITNPNDSKAATQNTSTVTANFMFGFLIFDFP